MKTFSDIYAEFVGTSKKNIKDEAAARIGKLNPEERKIAGTLTKAVMKADGIISGGETELIEMAMKIDGLDVSLDEAKKAILSTTDEEINKAKFDFRALSDQTKEDIIFCLLVVSSSDGFIAKDEYNLIKGYLA